MPYEIEQLSVGCIIASIIVVLLDGVVTFALIVGFIGWCVLIPKLIYNSIMAEKD